MGKGQGGNDNETVVERARRNQRRPRRQGLSNARGRDRANIRAQQQMTPLQRNRSNGGR